MSRRHTRATLPDCEHTTEAHAIWNATRAYAVEAEEGDPDSYWAHGTYSRDHPRPDWADWGLCPDCKAAWRGESPWRAELWAYVDSEAGTLPRGGRILKFDTPGKLPPAPTPREDKNLEKMKGRILEGLEKAIGKLNDPRTHGMAGKTIGPDTKGRWYTLEATDGSTALISPVTPAKGQEKCYPTIAQGGAEWIDLPAGFHLALKRVRLLADAGEGIRCEYDGRGLLTLSARSLEGETRESLDVDTPPPTPREVPAPFVCTLAAGYLDLVCGIWPLRWYLSRPEERREAPSRWNPKGRTWTEELPQHFEPGGSGAGWRFVIMPMRL